MSLVRRNRVKGANLAIILNQQYVGRAAHGIEIARKNAKRCQIVVSQCFCQLFDDGGFAMRVPPRIQRHICETNFNKPDILQQSKDGMEWVTNYMSYVKRFLAP